MPAKYEQFIADAADINYQPHTKTVRATQHNGETVMGIPGIDCDYTYVTCEQAKKFFGLTDTSQDPVWNDCKISFDYDGDTDLLWALLGDNIREPYKLPEGWSLNETDESGERGVVIFSVTGFPKHEDAAMVLTILQSIVLS